MFCLAHRRRSENISYIIKLKKATMAKWKGCFDRHCVPMAGTIQVLNEHFSNKWLLFKEVKNLVKWLSREPMKGKRYHQRGLEWRVACGRSWSGSQPLTLSHDLSLHASCKHWHLALRRIPKFLLSSVPETIPPRLWTQEPQNDHESQEQWMPHLSDSPQRLEVGRLLAS